MMNALYLLTLLVTFFLDYVIGIDENPLILCANRKSILGISLKSPFLSQSREIVGGLNRSIAVDYHYAKGLVVWTDVETEKIYSIPIFPNPRSATKQVLIESCVTPDGVAVDWIHDNLYWTDADTDVVAVARLVDGSLITTLVKKDLHEPRAIVIDPNVGLMFWTDWGRNPRIERAGMDGSQRRVIITSGIKWPNGLAIDLLARRIYWIDGSTRVLSSSNYEGKDEKVILTSAGTPLRHPFSLDILGDWLYWTDWSFGYEGLYKTNRKSGHEEWRKIVSGEDRKTLMGVKVYDTSKQPAGFNRCTNNNGGCTHLCLPAPGEVKYSCACPDSIHDSENCSTTPLELLLNSENERILYESHTVTHVPTGTIVLIIAIGIISIALVIFFVYRKCLKKILRQSASVDAQDWTGIDNPVYCDTTQQRVSFSSFPFQDGAMHSNPPGGSEKVYNVNHPSSYGNACGGALNATLKDQSALMPLPI